MEAFNRVVSDRMLIELNVRTNGSIKMENLIDIRVETPIVGVSKKKISGINYVWIGLENSKDGWISQNEFNKLTNKK
jgi:hypothetical protein